MFRSLKHLKFISVSDVSQLYYSIAFLSPGDWWWYLECVQCSHIWMCSSALCSILLVYLSTPVLIRIKKNQGAVTAFQQSCDLKNKVCIFVHNSPRWALLCGAIQQSMFLPACGLIIPCGNLGRGHIWVPVWGRKKKEHGENTPTVLRITAHKRDIALQFILHWWLIASATCKKDWEIQCPAR